MAIGPLVSRTSPLPLYYQVQEILRTRIVQGHLQPGHKIPTEAELCTQHDVSRITVRQAVTALVNEGLLYRSRGRGTFVASPRVSHVVSELISFTEEMAQRGLVATSRVLDAQSEVPSERIRSALQIPEGEEVFRIKRLRLADGEPLALQTAYLPRNRFPPIDVRRLETTSLYQILEEEYRIHLARAQEVYRPIILKRAEAAILNVHPRLAAFGVERTTFDAQNRPVEFVTSILRGDRMQLTLELIRKAGGGLVLETKGGAEGGERSAGHLHQ